MSIFFYKRNVSCHVFSSSPPSCDSHLLRLIRRIKYRIYIFSWY